MAHCLVPLRWCSPLAGSQTPKNTIVRGVFKEMNTNHTHLGAAAAAGGGKGVAGGGGTGAVAAGLKHQQSQQWQQQAVPGGHHHPAGGGVSRSSLVGVRGAVSASAAAAELASVYAAGLG